MYKLKFWELALIFGVLFALVSGIDAARTQEKLSDSLIRLHVIANSDSEADQSNKLAVRDAVLPLLEELSGQAESVAEMRTLLHKNMPKIEKEAETILRTAGCDDMVTGSLTNCYFPTKDYETFALPAGRYQALRLVIGEGKGENWWCVAFPPLCVGVWAKNIEIAAQAGFFTREQAEFLEGRGENYILKFRTIELLGQLKEWVLPECEEKVTKE